MRFSPTLRPLSARPSSLLESFERLGLSAPLLKAIATLGFENPTEIQQEAIPHLLAGDRDFIGLAQTGTGKTAAFGLPMLEHLDPKASHVQALILAPTRELGQQIAQQIELFAKQLDGIQTVAVYGGANIMTQIQQLRRPCHVVIATPGRLIDLAKRKAVKLDQLEYVILDEADEMLNMGFKEELDTILDMTPDSKRTWLFSATMPKEIRRMVKQYMDDPMEVRIDPQTAVNDQIDHQYATVRHTDKAEALARFMDMDPELFGVVFCRTKRDTQDLAETLMKKGYRADALHGDLSQPQRDRVMRRFKLRELQVLIATDVAARGIDVNDLTHVFHHSLPTDQAYYTHRSGRTARAGKTGISMAFINTREKAVVNRLSKGLGIEFTEAQIPDAKSISAARLERWAEAVLKREENQGLPADLWFSTLERFENMTKEEVLNRVVSLELSKLNITHGKDLNLKGGDDRGGGQRSHSGRGGYGGRSGKGGPRGRDGRDGPRTRSDRSSQGNRSGGRPSSGGRPDAGKRKFTGDDSWKSKPKKKSSNNGAFGRDMPSDDRYSRRSDSGGKKPASTKFKPSSPSKRKRY